MAKLQFVIRYPEIDPGTEIDAGERYYGYGESNILRDGKLLLSDWQRAITHLRNGIFKLYKDGRYRLIDSHGKDLIPYELSSLVVSSFGAVMKKDKFGYDTVDHYDSSLMTFKVRRASDNKENFVRIDGTSIYPHWFDEYDIQTLKSAPKYIKVKDGGFINYIGATSGELVSSEWFEDAKCDFKRFDLARNACPEIFVACVKYNGSWKTLTKNGII